MTKQFKPGIVKIIAHMSFYTAVGLYLCYFITVQYFATTKTPRPEGFFLPACAVAIAISIAVAAFKVLYLDYIIIDITENEVTITRLTGEHKLYRGSDHMFSPNVTKHFYYGFYVGTTKYLIVTGLGSGKKKSYNCSTFYTSDFNQIFSYIKYYGLICEINDEDEVDDEYEAAEEKAPDIVAYAPHTEMHSVFTIDKDLAVKDTRDSWLITTVAGIAVFVTVFIGMLVFGWKLLILLPMEFYVGICFYIIMFPLLSSTVTLVIARIRINKRMPERIILTANSISFDNQMFEFGEIRKIIATPLEKKRPNAYSNQRVITIVLQSGKKHSFILGIIHIDPRKPKVFAEYARLCYELKTLFLNEPEKFMIKME